MANYEQFDPAGERTAEVSDLGAELGARIGERLDAASAEVVSEGLTAAGRDALPAGTVALRHLDSGDVHALDASGRSLHRYAGLTASASDAAQPAVAARGVINPPVKRIIGACIGIGVTGGVTAETIVQMFNTPEPHLSGVPALARQRLKQAPATGQPLADLIALDRRWKAARNTPRSPATCAAAAPPSTSRRALRT